MVKGKPWRVEDERELRSLRMQGRTVAEVASRMNLSKDAVKAKLKRLGLKVDTVKNSVGSTTDLIIPVELPSVEEALLKLAGAMNALETEGLSKTEIARLRSIIQASGVYQKRFAEYVDYRGIEAELGELRRKYDELSNKTQAASGK